uniref:Autophagy-related protein 101 n=1 Tax=Trieres chinensis TaxID=1514140 RepID=A0A7S1ZEN7_TRICV|mmetsp:Transcript_24009/g.48592  ORF Transcript_24009/g.48592 Transcript_24009/m.48592 type:complete len:221 (+) Transcript_24009:84-746(+)|eukprot:CAMPEP_0183302026 /NCGR_PEP_ID=MMETSP0160_2-20130417/7958_1 /TAXON_ID=2839 ORGANISM="Odontella Sinensis, Strain Grunow 1884" /NCGR_SAMPLE_ID=MMETSP0160_2 /ASSEMBLY_ACC=CAM_ASM_000250 /LENGTH=220 /DNA_ID=CAMNT_0025464749 /DNA_START=73 /DNA_END=735 /DNA_ORIENTATION=-
MNCVEHYLPELELATGQVREALQAILHTILFIRSPGPVAPRDIHCEGFDLTYSRIANDDGNQVAVVSGPAVVQENDIDKKVDDSIEVFLRSLSQIGPELLSGCLTLSFFERRASRQLFGLVSHEERVVWEQWILRVVVNNTPRPVNDDSASVIERQRIQDTAEGMLKSAMLKIFELAGGSIDHIPPVMYEFEISCTKRADDRENVYSRVANMPSLIQLGN